MEQEKIGKFIATLRKEKKLTQMQLAEKLNITDRAVSKWERGKSMPDLSIMLELCKILDISVNELLIGERIKKEEMESASDINLVKALTVVERKEKMLKKSIAIVGIIIAIIAIIVFVGYLVYHNVEFVLDYNRTLVQCDIEDNKLVYRDYRCIGGMPHTIIKDEGNNTTYVFFQSTDFLENYIRDWNDWYEKVGYAKLSSSEHSNRSEMELDNDINLEDDKLKVYYTKTRISLNWKKGITEKNLDKLLKDSNLLLEYSYKDGVIDSSELYK